MADPILLRATPNGFGGSSFGPYPDLATLTATFPPARHAGRFGLVGPTGGPYTVYQSDGASWGAAGGGGFATAATITTISSFPYTVQTSDRGSVLRLASSTSATVNFPSGLGVGFHVGFVQSGTGVITFAAGSGAQVVNRQSFLKTAGQYAAGSAIATLADFFVLAGDLSA